MLMNNKEEYPFIKQAVLTALCRIGLVELPVPIKKIVKSFSNCRLIPYSRHMKTTNLTYDQFLEFSNTEDAFTDYYADQDLYVIYYNDIEASIKSTNRYRWNIAHELGHIMLEHHKKNIKSRLFRNELTDAEYSVLEEEADIFAAYILVPHCPLFYIHNIKTRIELKNICRISDNASYRRYKEYILWCNNGRLKSNYDLDIVSMFITRKVCSRCHAECLPHDSKCKICGYNHFLVRKDAWYMKYEGFEVKDHNGKILSCPICQNEDVPSGDYCTICGFSFKNKCQNCEAVLPSNARYCNKCGDISTYYKSGLLKYWKNEINELPF